MMKRFQWLNTFLFCFGYSLLWGATTATATITYSVESIDTIAISGNPGPLVVNTATAGSDPSTAIDNSTTFAVTTNNDSRNITCAVSSSMPTGVSLGINMDAPTGATSMGYIDMTTTPVIVVSGISNVAQASLGISYILEATVNAAQVSSATNIVTFTIGP